ncbi:hypothetical protein ACSCB1_27330 [Streptomyces europaeiscabiei]|uniref:hypothetical protein n=1 Tax=Streptomyces europaeiscabiei TaxID=146819 RepID=UPI000AD5CA6B|nr:hypothetical protein [Streptomyces europaeiscabiei]MDX3709321.1 hypothetical protein [Streptomyces europaeiscabiei]MDX3778867.1 hypothetical protein [Streptomyces europaeiscabiei]MDX3836428.1 hypothetical protein [Streptomyces europaeiscabiei]MDX3844297.1 hypothetical protein [Streptomyces europaeiscabiei]
MFTVVLQPRAWEAVQRAVSVGVFALRPKREHDVDVLHERRATPVGGRARPQDELHDPLRMKRLEEGGPDALRVEFEALAGEYDEGEQVPSVPASVDGLTAYTEAEGTGSPDTPAARSAYADELARRGRETDRPPPRNGPCWCGSERKCKKCCGNPALV